jgi:hypothetical protein
VLGSVLHGTTSDLYRAYALRLLQVASKRPRQEDVPATVPKTRRVERGDRKVFWRHLYYPKSKRAWCWRICTYHCRAGGGFTPRKRLSSSTSTKQTYMYVCDVCANTFLRSTNHANLRSHKGGQGCTRLLEAHKATRLLDKFLRKAQLSQSTTTDHQTRPYFAKGSSGNASLGMARFSTQPSCTTRRPLHSGFRTRTISSRRFVAM